MSGDLFLRLTTVPCDCLSGVHLCAMRLSVVYHRAMGLSMRFTTVSGDLFLRSTIVSWECLWFTTVPCNCLSVIQQCHGIVTPVQQYVHGMILRVHHCVMGFIRFTIMPWSCLSVVYHCVMGLSIWFTTVSWDCPSGSALCHVVVPLIHSCDSAHLVRLQFMGLTPWFTVESWDCLSGSPPCHTGLSLWFAAMSRVCSSGTPLCHGIVP